MPACSSPAVHCLLLNPAGGKNLRWRRTPTITWTACVAATVYILLHSLLPPAITCKLPVVLLSFAAAEHAVPLLPVPGGGLFFFSVFCFAGYIVSFLLFCYLCCYYLLLLFSSSSSFLYIEFFYSPPGRLRSLLHVNMLPLKGRGSAVHACAPSPTDALCSLRDITIPYIRCFIYLLFF